MDLLRDTYAIRRIDALRPNSQLPPTIPTIRQCVGTNRLWGAPLGRALYEDLHGSIPLKELVDIAIISRTILVLEDHIDDELLRSGQDIAWINLWILNLENELQPILQRIGEDINEHHILRLRARKEVLRRNEGTCPTDPYRSSIEKCLIFFNPYRLQIARRIKNYSDRLNFLEIFFFACQLLDDFQDLYEDQQKRTNHNLFYLGKLKSEQTEIQSIRLRWVFQLLRQIYANLKRNDVQKGAEGSDIFIAFLERGLSFLKDMLAGCQECQNESFFDEPFSNFESWQFDPVTQCIQTGLSNKYEKFIRPEFLQTYSIGFRELSTV